MSETMGKLTKIDINRPAVSPGSVKGVFAIIRQVKSSAQILTNFTQLPGTQAIYPPLIGLHSPRSLANLSTLLPPADPGLEPASASDASCTQCDLCLCTGRHSRRAVHPPAAWVRA